ncbi:MAG: hypothetical protein J3K34DRAFT_526994 [Monoraphidium minutum]|nr:MAG: hypothetical protein J3K34DRAFT_526994 [Monoraphidium minutum]
MATDVGGSCQGGVDGSASGDGASDARRALAAPPHERAAADVAAAAALLARAPFYAPLAREAVRCAARHARLLTLGDTCELPSAPGDDGCLFTLLEGAAWLVRGSRQDPQLIEAARRHEDAARARELGAAAAALQSACAGGGERRQQQEAVAPSFWPAVRDAAADAQRLRVEGGGGEAWDHGGVTAVLVEAGASFGGYALEWPDLGAPWALSLLQDACAQAAAPQRRASSSSESTLSGGRPGGADGGGLPPRCLAAVTEAGASAVIVALSRCALAEVLRLNAEAHAAAAAAECCRVPSLRHMPVRELTRLARHLRRAEFGPGEVLIHEGREIAGVFILTAGSVQLQVAGRAPAGGQPAAAAGEEAAAAGAAGVQGAAPPVVLGTRGPGFLLGDDYLRERRSACSAVALTPVSALRLPPHKLARLLDPLTLRLLGRLRPQLGGAAAAALQSEGGAAAARAAAAEEHRGVALAGAYGDAAAPGLRGAAGGGGGGGGGVPATLLREAPPGPTAQLQQRPRSPRAAGQLPRAAPTRPGWAAAHVGGAHKGGRAGAAPAAAAAAQPGGAPDGADWDAHRLPRGLTAAKCAGLDGGGSESVQQLVSAVRALDAARRASDTRELRAAPGAPPVSAAAAPGWGAREAPPGGDGWERHTDALERACVAVVDVAVVEGQATADDEDAAPTAIDDAAAKFAAAAHDAGLQLARWGPGRYLLIAELPAGGGGGGGAAAARAAARGAADCLLAMQRGLAGVVARAACPHIRLCAGFATGACFLESVAGDFIVAASGRAFDAAARLAALAAARPCGGDALIASDAARQLLAGSHELRPAGGGYLLSTPAARRSSADGQPQPDAPRGGGRWGGGGGGAIAARPRAGAAAGAGVRRAAAAAARRRLIRKKYEALETLLAHSEGLQPAPEHLLTQPPPARGGVPSQCEQDGGAGGPSGGAAGGGGARAASRASCPKRGGAPRPGWSGGTRGPGGGGDGGGAARGGAAARLPAAGRAMETRLQVWQEVERLRSGTGGGGGAPDGAAAPATPSRPASALRPGSRPASALSPAQGGSGAAGSPGGGDRAGGIGGLDLGFLGTEQQGQPLAGEDSGSSLGASSGAAVAAACKGMGSAAGADCFAAALAPCAAAVDLSACGLWRLPDLDHIHQAESLAAGFNHLASLDPAPRPARGAAHPHHAAPGAPRHASRGGGMLCALGVAPLAPGDVLIESGVGRLPARLAGLGLAFNEVASLPARLVGALPRLEELDLSYNRRARARALAELPPNLAGWSRLKTLCLAGNALAALPPGVTGLASLELLDASHNALAALPPGLQHLQALTSLRAAGNALSAAPPGLAALTGLAELDLSGNRLRPGGVDAAVLAALTRLSCLRLANNPGLFDAPPAGGGVGGEGRGDDAGAAERAAWLDAWLRGGPPPAAAGPDADAAAGSGGGSGDCAEAQLLPALVHLDLSSTGLPSLPAWLPAGVCELRAARNRLSELPAWACARLAGSLRALDLRGNPLARLPSDVTRLGQLQLLLTEGCPCTDPEAAAPGGGDGGGGGGSPRCRGAGKDAAPPEGSAAWAAGWLTARKAGRPWPPGPGARRLPAALLAAAGVPQPLDSSRTRGAHPALLGEQGAAPAGDAPGPPAVAFGGARRRAAIHVLPSAAVDIL